MLNEIIDIGIAADKKKALVIDKEIDFCALLKYYLSRKNYNVATAGNLSDSLKAIDSEIPDLIIADRHVHDNFENLLREKINKIPFYSPQLIFIENYKQKREGAVMYTLNRNEDDSLGSKLKRIITYIKDLFR